MFKKLINRFSQKLSPAGFNPTLEKISKGFTRNHWLFYSMIASFSLFVWIWVLIIYTCVDRSDYSVGLPIVCYSFISISFIGMTLCLKPSLKNAKTHGEHETVKYLFWAYALSWIFVGQWMFIYIHKASGIAPAKIKEAFILYAASKVDYLMVETDILKKIDESQKEEVQRLIDFKKEGILKKYEANYYIALILSDAEVLGNLKIDRKELMIIASNII